MSDDKNIDDFIKNRLAATAEAADEWTIPPDELWERARLLINEPKKRKRRFLLWFFWGILLGGTLLSAFYFVTPKRGSIIAQVVETTAEVALSHEAATVEFCPEETSAKTISIPPKTEKQLQAFNENPSKSNDDSRKIADTTTTSRSSAITPVLLPIKKEMLVPETPVRPAGTNLGPLPSLPFAELHAKQQEDILPLLNILDTATQKELNWNWELGLSYSRFPVNPFTDDQEQHRQNNKYLELLSSSYRSINLVATKTTQKNLSLTSGLYYTQQKIDVAFGLDTIVYRTDEKNVEKGINELITRAGASTLANEDALSLILFPTANVTDGDTLNLFGSLPVQLDVYQFPLIFNLHFNKNRFEYVASIGLSIDLLKIRIDELPVEVFKKNTLVSNDVNFQSYEVSLSRASFYLGGGLKYPISPAFNASFSIKLEPFAREFSRYEMGLHYRF